MAPSLRAVLAVALPALSLGEPLLPAETIAQFPLGTWLENIAVRPNGDILITALEPSASVYGIRQSASGRVSSRVLAEIPSVQNLYGISEVAVDGSVETYLVVGGNSSAIATPVPGTLSSWTVPFHKARCGGGGGDEVKVGKVSDMGEDGRFLNGVTSVPDLPNAVLVADSSTGLIGRLGLASGDYGDAASVFPELLSPPRTPPCFRESTASTSAAPTSTSPTPSPAAPTAFARTPSGYPEDGAAVQVVAGLSGVASALDDFAFDEAGNIVVATNFDNSAVYVDLASGESKTVVGGIGEMTVAGDAAAAFGRGLSGAQTLYVSTSGALGEPVQGNRAEGGKVVAADTRALLFE